MRSLLRACALAVLACPLLAAGPAAGSTPASWSSPATLSPCPAAGPAHATFPRDKPTHATGQGAVVWTAAPHACPSGAGVFVAPIGASDTPGAPSYARTPGGARLVLRAPLALAPAAHGELAIAGSASAPTRGDGVLVQGSAAGPFAPLGTIAGVLSPGSLFTGYLGDVAAASPTGGGGERGGARVDVERYFAHALSPSRIVPASAGAVQALTVSLDFRTDAIVAWRQGGALYAHDLPASGASQPTQRLASVGPAARIAALISDDNRAIVAWADERSGKTSIYLDDSAAGVRFGKPQLLERFANPSALPYPSTSPRLTRLSSESVMLAWSGAQDGHWVVRTAAIDLNGLRKVNTISAPGTDALLDDLQPGPDGEAIALWSEPQRTTDGKLETSDQAIVAARGIDARPGITIFGGPEQVAPPGPNSGATLAFDPGSDRALALWLGAGGDVDYAVRSPAGH
ncbi:MAG TPA: hypothetical protein VG188_03030 [Solirubrobacteraceae bacterium]|jgi:hypothetical protein|nr:hypothetical protein [Solirubrobacteraceae bacterium]